MTERPSVPSGQRHTRRSATFIGAFTFAARIVERLGAFGQIALIASVYGSGFLADRYFIAAIGPLIIGAIAGEGLAANVLPALVRREGERQKLVAAGFWLAVGALLVVTAAYLAVAWLVVRIAAPAGSTGVAVWWAFAPIGPLLALSGYLAGVLTFHERYVWPPFRAAIATVAGFALTGLVVIFTHDLTWVAAAVSAGYAISFVALVVEVRRVAGRGALGRPTNAFIKEAFGLRGGLAAPVLGGLLGGQAFVLLERALASTIGVGAVSTLSYARGVVFTPVIIAQSIALGVYPGMLRAFEASDLDQVRRSFVRGCRLTVFLSLATASLFVLFGRDTIDVLLERGAFDPSAARRAGAVLGAFSLALVGTMVLVFVGRVFYAVSYFRGVVWAQLIALVVYAALALPLRAEWKMTGLAVAFGLAEVVGAAAGLVMAGRRIALPVRSAFVEMLAPAFVRAAPVAAGLLLSRVIEDRLALDSSYVRLGIALVVGGALTAGMLWSAGWPEVGPIKRRLLRFVPRV
jgi:peptidoglycan biosynthesis protein MviN/MurJ (putative lipid II flippase)